MPTKTSDTLKINLSGTWPDGAGYLFDYDKDIISLSQNGTELTLTAKKAGTTDFAINIVNKNNNNTLITSASCDIYVNNATYNVKYDANGGTGAPSTQTKTHGENLTISSQKPEKKGYVFSCWTSNPDGSGTYAISGSTYTLNQDMLFYAYYKPIQYHIVFDKNGADGGTTSTSKHTYDKEQELPLNSLTKRGYTFLGWSEDPYATAPTYADGATVKNLSATEGSVVTLYAVWKEGHYGDVNNDGAITFDDCLLLNKAITESITVTPWIFVMGDVNGDGELTIVDTTLINKVRLGSSDSFPVDTMDKEINITTSAKKLQYFIGDTISIDGIGLSLHYPETGVSYDITSFCEFYLPGTDISGTKTVSVYFNGLRTKYSVTVTQPTITLSANTKTIIKGNTTTITATTNPSGQSVTWTSSNNNVATVSNGKITAKTTGSATITAKFTCNGIIYSKTCNVTVAEPAHTHTSGSWIVDEQVTCTANGSKHKECIDCGDILETQTIVATGHVLGDWIVDNQATVYKPGTKHRDCLLCMMYLEEAEIPQLKCAKPVLKKVYNANSYVKVTWDVVEGADKYRVYRKTGTGDYEYIGSTSNTYFNDKEAGAGKTCRYRIKAKNEAGYSEYSESLALKHVDEPTLKSIENSAYGVLIKWDKVTGAEKYSVYRKVSGGEYKYIGATSNTYYTDKTAKSGTKYYYAIRAKKGETVSALSNTKSIYHLADPTLNTPTSTTSGIKLSWSKVTGAEGYMVYRKTGSGSYSKIATVKGSTIVTYTDKSAKKGKKYTYKIKAYKSKTYSAYSNTKTITDTY